MATVTLYDSVTSDVPANVWGGYFISTELPMSSRPDHLGISIVPAVAPQPGWNVAAWACTEFERESTRWCCGMTAVGLYPDIAGLPYTVLDDAGVTRSSGRIQGFRGVRWSIERWVGPCRVRVVRFTNV
jgi:hypothetical protein